MRKNADQSEGGDQDFKKVYSFANFNQALKQIDQLEGRNEQQNKQIDQLEIRNQQQNQVIEALSNKFDKLSEVVEKVLEKKQQ